MSIRISMVRIITCICTQTNLDAEWRVQEKNHTDGYSDQVPNKYELEEFGNLFQTKATKSVV